MAVFDDEWFEIWYTGEDPIPVYVLYVVADRPNRGKVRVVDPFKNNEKVFEARSYEEVCSWLWEDEYHLVNGREFPDNGR